MYYAIDLNKGNGNYIPELIYDYIPENEHYIGVDNPKVYNDIMYFVKNSNEIIAYNVITREEKTIKKFKNDTNFFGFKINSSSEVMLDKEKNTISEIKNYSLICEPNKYYMETPDDAEEYSQIINLIVEDENDNKKTLIERFNYQSFNNIGVSDGIYYY